MEGVEDSFNAGVCCGEAMEQGVDDVAAALAAVDQVATSIPVDADRLYVTGFPNGGAMTYRMACETDRFAAFGPVGGGQVVDCADRAPTSILHIHGAADTTVPIGGDPAGMGHPPIEETLAGWRAFQQCESPVKSSSGGVRRSSAACAGNREVGLIVVDGLTNTWPTTANGLAGAETLWQFFAGHRR